MPNATSLPTDPVGTNVTSTCSAGYFFPDGTNSKVFSCVYGGAQPVNGTNGGGSWVPDAVGLACYPGKSLGSKNLYSVVVRALGGNS